MSEIGASIWLGDDGILRIRYPRNCNLTLDFMEQVHEQRLAVADMPCPLLVYADTVASAEYEAQQFASRDDVAERVTAMAVIVKSVFTRAMADLFMRFHKPPYPTRFFRAEAAALDWLGQYRPDRDMPSATGQ